MSVCRQVEVCATGRFPFQRGLTDSDLSLCVIYKPQDGAALAITYKLTMRRVRDSLLSWKSIKYYILVCVHVYAGARIVACMYVCARACRCTTFVIFGPSGFTIFFDFVS
jgi:hypothetical protein